MSLAKAFITEKAKAPARTQQPATALRVTVSLTLMNVISKTASLPGPEVD